VHSDEVIGRDDVIVYDCVIARDDANVSRMEDGNDNKNSQMKTRFLSQRKHVSQVQSLIGKAA
jgi:hypothetical protein